MAKGSRVTERGGESHGEEIAEAPARVRVATDDQKPLDYDDLLRELDEDISEFADDDDKSAYWDAQAKKRVVEFLKFADQSDSTVGALMEISGPDGKGMSETFDGYLDQDSIATNAAQYNGIKDGLDKLQNRIEDNLADKLLNLPLGIGSIGKYVARRILSKTAIRALRKRLKQKIQERIKRRRQRRERRRDCTNRGNPVSMSTGFAVHVDPAFVVDGAMPVEVGSVYYSGLAYRGVYGRCRVSEMDAEIRATDDGRLAYMDDDGFPVFFARPPATPGGWTDGDTVRPLRLAAASDRGLVLGEGPKLTHFRKFKDGVWRVERVEDRNGIALVFSRDADGLLASVATPEGLTLHFAYSIAGLRTLAELEGLSGERKEIMRWEYDPDGNMTAAHSRYGHSAEFGYDGRGHRVAMNRSDGYRSQYEYDDRARVVACRTNGAFDGDRFEYDDGARTTTYFPGGDPARRERFFMDENQAIVAEENALGLVTRSEFDDEGRLSAEIDAEGNRSGYQYDGFGNIKSIADPEGRQTFFYWDEYGNLEISIDPEAASWDHEYDEKGNLVATTDPLGHRTDITNDARGLPTGTMRHDGLIERRSYDRHRRLTAITDFRSATTEFSYDAFNRLSAITDPLGHVTRYGYEDQPGLDFRQPTTVTRPDGVVLTCRFDETTSEIRLIDGEGRTTIHRHDVGPNGLLSQAVDAGGGTLRFRYDSQERLIRVENQQGVAWTFERDGAGRIVRETDHDGRTTDYAYDRADRLVRTDHVDGSTLAYSYDRSGLLTEELVFEPGSDKPGPASSVFRYDGRGLLAAADNEAASVVYERDRLGRIVSETVNGRRVESVFDCCGNRTLRRIGTRTETYAFDPLGSVKSIAIDGHEALTFQHDLMGQELSCESPAGFHSRQRWDSVGQLAGQRVTGQRVGSDGFARAASGQGAGAAIVERAYAWSRAFEPLAVHDSVWGETRHDYDRNGQVTQSRFGDGASERFLYDRAFNVSASAPGRPAARRDDGAAASDVWQRSGLADAAPGAEGLRPWLTSPGGKVRESLGPAGERVSLTWDDRGRVVDRRVERNGFRPKIWRYRWDAKDRMVGCVTPQGDRWRYRYDAFGRRLSKIDETSLAARSASRADDPAGRIAAVGTAYLWDGDVPAEVAPLLGETEADWSAATRWHFSPGTFRPLARQQTAADGAATAGRLHFIVTDAIGTPREIFTETGEAVWMAEFSTWGALRQLWLSDAVNDNEPPGGGRVVSIGSRRKDAESGIPIRAGRLYSEGNLALAFDEDAAEAAQFCPIRFQGQWQDAETGLTYNRHRHYDPATTGYSSVDPIGLAGGFRPHAYVDQPFSWLDPLGLEGRMPGSGSMPNVPGMQRQHLIPWQLRNHPVINQAGNLFDINGPRNMLYMPKCQGTGTTAQTSRNSGLHRGYTTAHRKYNQDVQDDLDSLYDRSRQNKWSKKCVARELMKLQLKYRTLLSTGALSLAPPCTS